MRTLFLKIIGFICICCTLQACQTRSGIVDGKIANWEDNKQAAVSLTFDDWSPGHFLRVVPELKQRNMTGTFYVYINYDFNWDDIRAAAADGMEIGNHTVSHCCEGTGMQPDQYEPEVLGAKNTIEKSIPKVYTYCYPCGLLYDNDSLNSYLRETGHIAARSVLAPDAKSNSYDFATTENDYYRLKTVPIESCFNYYEIKDKENYFDLIEPDFAAYTKRITDVISGGGLLTFCFHGINDPFAWANIPVELFREHLDILEGYRDKVWVTTLANAVKYHREAQSASLQQIKAPENNRWIINLTHALPDKETYNYPLTVMLKMNGVNYNTVTQNSKQLPYTASNDTIMFKAVPDGGNIILEANGKGIAASTSYGGKPLVSITPGNLKQ